MRLLVLLLTLCACSQDPATAALEGCRGRYGSLWRMQLRGDALPKDSKELAVLMIPEGKDPWGNDYYPEIDLAGIVVWSWGPDGKPETDDDICYPPSD